MFLFNVDVLSCLVWLMNSESKENTQDLNSKTLKQMWLKEISNASDTKLGRTRLKSGLILVNNNTLFINKMTKHL